MQDYLAISRIPEPVSEGFVRAALDRLSQGARELGVRPVETIYSLERAEAYSLFKASSAQAVKDVHVRAGLPTPDVFPTERVFTELLHARE